MSSCSLFSTASIALTRVLHSLDNNFTDDELWGRISGENVRLGLECEILVTRKRNLGGDMRPSAHMQFKVCVGKVFRSRARC